MKTHLGWYGPAAPDVQSIPYIPFSTQLESGNREIAVASVSECSLCHILSTFFREWVSSIVGSICEGGKICLAHPTILPIFSRSGQSRCLENASAFIRAKVRTMTGQVHNTWLERTNTYHVEIMCVDT